MVPPHGGALCRNLMNLKTWCDMIDLLLVSIAKAGNNPVDVLPAPSNPADWGTQMGVFMDALEENIYFAAGMKLNSAGVNRRVMSYNIQSKLYTEYPQLPSTFTTTSYVQLWCKDGSIYVNRSGEMYRLNIGESTWTKLSNPTTVNNMPAYGGQTVIYNGRLLCYGLLASPGYEQAICEYNPVNNSFVRVAISPKKLYQTYTGLSVIGTKFYMLNNDNTLSVYDIATNTWSTPVTVPITYYTRAQGASVTKVYLFGGNTPTFDSTFAYTPASNTFEQLANLKLDDTNALMVSDGVDAYVFASGKLTSYKLE